MKLGHAILFAGLLVGKRFLFQKTISWSDVEEWVRQNGNPDLSGAGYTGNTMSGGSSNSYAEIRQEHSGGKLIVTANIFFNRSQGIATRKSWSGAKLDTHLQKRFGDNMRFRIKL